MEYYKFGLYYMGQTSTSARTWATAQYLTDVVIPVKVDLYNFTETITLGTTGATGTITLNSNGKLIDNSFGIKNSVIGCPLEVFPGYAFVNRIASEMAKLIVNLKDYVPIQFDYTDRNYYFALANETQYASARYYTYTTGSERGITYRNDQIPIRNKSDNSAIPNTNTFNIFPLPQLMSASGAYSYMARTVYKYKDKYKIVTFWARYESIGNDVRVIPNASALTAEEVAFMKNVEFIPGPYDDGGTSTVDKGGSGSFDDSSDPILPSSTPSLTVADTGFVRIYNPTLSQLKALAQYMWTDSDFLQTLVNHAKQLLENPIESVISLNLLPCSIPSSAVEEVKVLFIGTGVNMPPATTQFVDVDCGSLTVSEFYGSALDYSPYTKIHCYLPYIGQVTLDTDEVMNSTLSIKYRIDIVTGMCVAMISVNGSILYQFSGHCAISMPLTSADFSTYVSAAIGTAKAVAGIAAAGAGAGGTAAQLLGTAAPRTTTTTFDSADTVRNPATGRQVKAGTHHEDTSVTSKGSSFGEMATAAAVNTVSAVMGSKTVVEHSGGFTGNSGYLAVRRPYLIIEIPRMCNPADYGKFNGYPSMITSQLSNCEGYTKVQNIQLTGFSATNEEMSEIAEMLMGGVLF